MKQLLLTILFFTFVLPLTAQSAGEMVTRPPKYEVRAAWFDFQRKSSSPQSTHQRTERTPSNWSSGMLRSIATGELSATDFWNALS